jgi:phosphatidylethanolamine/phosphatidyl-N-methylethanolamine N-methyltransferase
VRPDLLNRWRYSLWAPWYDAMMARATRFDEVRRHAIERLCLQPGDRLLIVGAGTGLDLPHVPPAVHVTAVDVTPAMLARLRLRATDLGRDVAVQIADARQLPFESGSFDAVILHLVLAVMPDPASGLLEAERVVKPGGRISVFDKFLRVDERPSMARRLGNLPMRLLFTDLNRRLEPLVAGTSLVVEQDEAAAFGGMYRAVTLRKPS